MNKQTVIHPYHGTQLSNNKKQTIDAHTTWIDLQKIMFKKIQYQIVAYSIMPLIQHIEMAKL